MKTPGDYALLAANGMKWADLVEEIRTEAIEDYLSCEPEAAQDITPGTQLESVVFPLHHNPVQDSFR